MHGVMTGAALFPQWACAMADRLRVQRPDRARADFLIVQTRSDRLCARTIHMAEIATKLHSP